MRDNAVEITRHAFRNRRDFREFKEILQSGGFLSEDVCPPKTKKKKKVEPVPTLRIIGKDGKPIKVKMPVPQDYEIIECEPEKSNNLISIGGLAGWDEQVAPILRSRTWREFREDQLDALLTEKKNRRKKKTRTPVQQNKESGLSDRQRKIERLDRDPGHWRGLT